MSVRELPIILTRSRLVLGPLVLILAVFRAAGWILAVLMITALLTDVFDGVIARRLRIVTAGLRVADSRADGIYTVCTVAAIAITHMGVVFSAWNGLSIVVLLEALTNVVDRRRYGRPCSHHAYSAKLWALSYCVFAVAVLAFGRSQPYLDICIGCGVINNIEGYVIRYFLPLWAHDVSGIPAAIRLGRIQRSQLVSNLR